MPHIPYPSILPYPPTPYRVHWSRYGIEQHATPLQDRHSECWRLNISIIEFALLLIFPWGSPRPMIMYIMCGTNLATIAWYVTHYVPWSTPDMTLYHIHLMIPHMSHLTRTQIWRVLTSHMCVSMWCGIRYTRRVDKRERMCKRYASTRGWQQLA
jgi:hypothetical protein